MFLSRYPLFLVLVFQTGLAMLVPSVHALALGEFSESRIFFYAALLLILVASFVGIALQKHTRSALSQRDQLLILFGAFVGLPLLMAIPFQEAAGNLTYFEAYFEMVSSFTTTGAS
ncbi:MAG: TrkH family potassium uptake protein, partial [Paracoccaceae bacterium]|nr:TrkH family potassium uptake protein [Paracoccaceae bacterium]